MRFLRTAVLTKLLFLLCSPAFGQLTGKLDLGSPPQGFIMRDIKNGQWRGGYSKSLYNVSYKSIPLFYVGYNHTWNAERGNSALGLGLGTKQTLSTLIGATENVLSVSSTAPGWAKYLGNILSIEANGGYMPVHTEDVKGPYIYGFGFQLDLTDVFSILSKGL